LGDEAAERHQLLRVDLADGAATAEAVQAADPDLVLHLAAESHVDRSIDSPGAFIESNVTGTFSLLEAVRSHWEALPAERQAGFRLHHISTDEVFGSLGETGRFSETTPYDPRSPYSASKAASDHLVNAWHHTYGLPVVLTNCSNNYGPWQFPEKLIPVVIQNLLGRKAIPVYGDGLNVRDWLHVKDHCLGLYLALTKGVGGEIYNIGGGTELSNMEITQKILDHFEKSLDCVDFVSDRLGHDFRYSVNWDKANKQLGYSPTVSFESGLQETIEWYQANQQWWKPLKQTR
jgi:dTDP-glucose 4,6-dehydratase